ncbi:MAG: low-complexity tail membrane protein [Cyanobacteriota bacterium]|nr:low-complexity tail membrane protein [Cyanobacteriota bacterium]
MPNFRLNPYLWIHLCGIAVLPLWFSLCLLGFAIDYPIGPVSIELSIVASLGILPILAMQWFRPFYIFSILLIAIKPNQLTPTQRQILTRFKTPLNQKLAGVAPIILIPLLWQLYRLAPIAANAVSLSLHGRIIGLLIASFGFLGANLFLQVPISAIAVLLTQKAEWTVTEPLNVEQICQGFTRLGLGVNRILPPSLFAESSEFSFTSQDPSES